MSAIVIAVIAAVASVAAAVVAGLFAMATRRFEARLKRIDQVAEPKRDMYVPLVDMLERMFTSDGTPTADELAHKRRFDTWITVYGSNGAVRAYSRFMQALPAQPPGDIQFRLYADFLLEVRKEMGDPTGNVDRLQILGPRLANLSDRRSLTDPDLEKVCDRAGWTPPWRT
ncbi:MAG TPA: hypothetical protein VH969_30555 [Actinophytocola sp.]|uniref:hypothetical protein n=1 Tax=Actinophytocola sp. TaxID=1872138 RepID=UPI002F93A030